MSTDHRESATEYARRSQPDLTNRYLRSVRRAQCANEMVFGGFVLAVVTQIWFESTWPHTLVAGVGLVVILAIAALVARLRLDAAASKLTSALSMATGLQFTVVEGTARLQLEAPGFEDTYEPTESTHEFPTRVCEVVAFADSVSPGQREQWMRGERAVRHTSRLLMRFFAVTFSAYCLLWWASRDSITTVAVASIKYGSIQAAVESGSVVGLDSALLVYSAYSLVAILAVLTQIVIAIAFVSAQFRAFYAWRKLSSTLQAAGLDVHPLPVTGELYVLFDEKSASAVLANLGKTQSASQP